MLSEWLQERRAKKRAGIFWRLLEQGQVAPAVEFYRTDLAPSASRLTTSLRAAYHLHCWLAEPNDEDRVALRKLASGLKDTSQVTRAWKTVERFDRERRLSHLLRRRDTDGLLDVLTSPAEGGAPKSSALEQLAVAILESYAAGTRETTATESRREVAGRVLDHLPKFEDLPGPSVVYAHLFVWASFTLGRPEAICDQAASIAAFGPARAKELRLAAADSWGRRELRAGHADRAMSALELMAEAAGSSVRRAIIVQWGTAALEYNAGNALWWFSHHCPSPHSDPQDPILMVGLALAYFKNGQHARAREVLAHFDGAERRLSPVSSRASSRANDVTAQAQVLLALSWLASTDEWPAGSAQEDPEGRRLDRDLRVKNRVLWGTTRTEIDAIAARLEAGDSELSWWGALLAGLLAYADSHATFTLAAIAKFVAAAEHVQSAAARTRLRAIEATLTSKAKATEEAVALIQQKRYQHLREFKETILAHFEEGIPSLVRAAVYLTLWQHDDSYDPLPDLKRIAVTAPDEVLIGNCIAEVVFARTLGEFQTQLLERGGSRAIPPLEQVKIGGNEFTRQAALAAALIYLHRGDVAAAGEMLQHAEDDEEGHGAYVRFYAAWRRGDTRTCRALIDAHGESDPLLRRYREEATRGLRVRELFDTLEHNEPHVAWAVLQDVAAVDLHDGRFVTVIVSVVVSLMRRRQPSAALVLLHLTHREIARASSAGNAELTQLTWACLALEPVVEAQLGHFSACIDANRRLAASSLPAQPVFGRREGDEQIAALCRLIRIEAELGMTAASVDDVRMRCRSVQRTLDEYEPGLIAHEAWRPYVSLISGLLTFVATDALVDDATLEHLTFAQRVLDLDDHAAFLENVIGALDWRRRVLGEFWAALSAGNLTGSRLIYQEELVPAFGQRMPHRIQFGMILADWGVGAGTTDELLRRLEVIEHEAPELDAEVIEQARQYIHDGDKLRHLTSLLSAQRFDQIIEQVNRLAWSGLPAGSMPLPVAIAQLYAYFKTKNTEIAERFAVRLTETRNIPDWVRDDGALLLGYVLFDKREFPKAADAFQRITRTHLLGHDTARYWAAAQFNHGIQLLEVDQRDKAFDAFARSLGDATGSGKTSGLASLFLHFGLKGIESNNGLRARHAFSLAAKSLEDAESSPDVAFDQLLTEIGLVLCHALMDEDIQDLTGDRVLELTDGVEAAGSESDPGRAARLERVVRIIAVCQELRRQRRLSSKRGVQDIRQMLLEQSTALEALEPVLKQRDPLVRVLRGLVDLLLSGKGKHAAALAALEEAFRLGVHSPRLGALLEAHRDLIKLAMDRSGKALDLFDAYLSSGGVPAELVDRLMRDDDLAELYRANRGYVPSDIAVDGVQSGVEVFRSRLEKLLEFTRAEPLNSDALVRSLTADLRKLLDRITETEEELSGIEHQIMKKVAAALTTDTLALGAPETNT